MGSGWSMREKPKKRLMIIISSFKDPIWIKNG